jgi:hypothetical protein
VLEGGTWRGTSGRCRRPAAACSRRDLPSTRRCGSGVASCDPAHCGGGVVAWSGVEWRRQARS